MPDTGCGIKAADQERLFAAFEQIKSAASHPYEGTGLGLYICQTLADRIGAEITFNSEFGQGSVSRSNCRSRCNVPAGILVIEDNEANLS